jgi:hypothetical protein
MKGTMPTSSSTIEPGALAVDRASREWWHFDYGDWRRYRLGNQTFEQIGAGS